MKTTSYGIRENLKDYAKAKTVELKLLRESNKLLKNATSLNPLQKWIGRKYWAVRPNGVVDEEKIKDVFIKITSDEIGISAVGSDGTLFDDTSFLNEFDAIALGQQVAGTYVSKLITEKEWLERELSRITDAINTAKEPPEKIDPALTEAPRVVDPAYIKALEEAQDEEITVPEEVQKKIEEKKEETTNKSTDKKSLSSNKTKKGPKTKNKK